MDSVLKVKEFIVNLFWINRIRRMSNLHGKRLYQLMLVQAWMMLYMYLFALAGTLLQVVTSGDPWGLLGVLGVAVVFPLLFRVVALGAAKLNGLPLD